MKCFIHLNDEAISVCKKCGKAMCMNCSAYSNHSGICPECRRDEFISERSALNTQLSANKKATVLSIVLAVLFAVAALIVAFAISLIGFILLIGTLGFGIRTGMLFSRRRPIESRINYLTGEIDKLGVALNRGSSII